MQDFLTKSPFVYNSGQAGFEMIAFSTNLLYDIAKGNGQR